MPDGDVHDHEERRAQLEALTAAGKESGVGGEPVSEPDGALCEHRAVMEAKLSAGRLKALRRKYRDTPGSIPFAALIEAVYEEGYDRGLADSQGAVIGKIARGDPGSEAIPFLNEMAALKQQSFGRSEEEATLTTRVGRLSSRTIADQVISEPSGEDAQVEAELDVNGPDLAEGGLLTAGDEVVAVGAAAFEAAFGGTDSERAGGRHQSEELRKRMESHRRSGLAGGGDGSLVDGA